MSSSSLFLKGGIWNWNWCFRVEKEKKIFSYKFFKEILKFIKNYWYRRQKFYPGYFFVYPKLNQCLKWRFHYIIVGNKNIWTICWIDFLNSWSKVWLVNFLTTLSRFHKSGAFFVLIKNKKSKGKILNDDLKYLCDTVQFISENTNRKFGEHYKEFCSGFFLML